MAVLRRDVVAEAAVEVVEEVASRELRLWKALLLLVMCWPSPSLLEVSFCVTDLAHELPPDNKSIKASQPAFILPQSSHTTRSSKLDNFEAPHTLGEPSIKPHPVADTRLVS